MAVSNTVVDQGSLAAVRRPDCIQGRECGYRAAPAMNAATM
jgi:hypothetical protein